MLVGFSVGQFVLEGLLSLRQYKVLQRTKAPKVLEGEVTQKVFDQSQVRSIAEHQGRATASLRKGYEYRHMVAQRPSSVSSQVSTVKSRISLSSTAMSSPSSGASVVSSWRAIFPVNSRVKSPRRSCLSSVSTFSALFSRSRFHTTRLSCSRRSSVSTSRL